MKKTLLTALLCLGIAASAHATTTTFTDLKKDTEVGSVTYTAPTQNSTIGTIAGSPISETAGRESAWQYASSVTLTLDLTVLSGVTSATQLFQFNTNRTGGYSAGLYATLDETDGVVLTFGYDGNIWNSYSNTKNVKRDIDDLYTAATVFTDASGHDLVAITIATEPLSKTAGDKVKAGVSLYTDKAADVNDTFMYSSGLGGSSASGVTLSSISVNTAYVTAIAITDTNIQGLTAANAATALMNTVAVPEPATATLSLLALAGLAARRRRK